MDENRIKEYTLEDGTKVTAYIPENVNDQTPIFYYSYVVGSDYKTDPVWQGMEEDMARYDGDAIVIIPHDKRLVIGGSDERTHLYQNNAIEAFNIVKEDLNIETTQFINGGFSAGFGYGTRTLAHYLQNNPDADRQVLLAVDGVINPTANLQQSELDALKENGTVIISFTQQKNHEYQSKLFKSTGLPILYVVDNSIPENTPDSQYWGIHDQVAMDFFDKGIYEQVINFALGKSDLNLPEGYSLRYYNPETGEIIRNITPEMARELLGINSITSLSKENQLYLATLGDISIKSDDKTLESYLNNIRKAIRNTSFLTANFNEASYQSTTQVPTAIPTIVNDYFAMTASLLTSIANKTVTIAKIASEIEILDNNLSNKAEELNNAQGLYVIADPIIEQSLIDTSITNIVSEDEKYADIVLTPPTVEDTEEVETPIVQQEEVITTTPTIPVEEPKQETSTEVPPQSSTGNETSPQPGPSTGTTTEQPEEKEFNIEESFPKYEELYSTDNQTVYNYNDEYKVVIHHDGDKVIGVEHYYDYGSKDAATTAVEQLQEQYKDVENFDKIIQQDQYVKVIFKEDMYNDLTLDELKETYKELEEVENK